MRGVNLPAPQRPELVQLPMTFVSIVFVLGYGDRPVGRLFQGLHPPKVGVPHLRGGDRA